MTLETALHSEKEAAAGWKHMYGGGGGEYGYAMSVWGIEEMRAQQMRGSGGRLTS